MEEYFGQAAFEKYGKLVFDSLRGMAISKAKSDIDKPNGLRFEAKVLCMDMFDLLRCLEGMCYNGLAYEVNDHTYVVGDILELMKELTL